MSWNPQTRMSALLGGWFGGVVGNKSKAFVVVALAISSGACTNLVEPGVRVGTAAAEFEADDSMIIAGGITAGNAAGQEGKLRAVAVVLEKKPFDKLAIVACDILMMTRQHLDPVVAEVAKSTGISA